MKKIILLALLLIATFPVSVTAIPVVYSASGSVTYYLYSDNAYELQETDFHGHMVIDDEAIVSHESSSIYWYHYSVLNFNLFTEYDTWGSENSNAGQLLIEVAYGSWFGNFRLPSGFDSDTVNFLSADGTNLGRSPESSSTLPPLISWYIGGIPSSSVHTNPLWADVLFTKTASVPEPGNVILLMLGLAGFGFQLTKRFRNNYI